MAGRGLIVAAPASGSGKTLVTLGLLRHLRRRGLRVAAAKAGPDYIDPGFLAAASGAECVNLDAWAMRPRRLASLVQGLEDAADLVVCEGVMGLFDGAGASGDAGSTANLARFTGWPVVLAVDVARQGASVAALVRGFTEHDPEVRIAGVILNRIGGARHRAIIEAALCRHLPALGRYGSLPRDPRLALPSRHLGLVLAEENGNLDALIEDAAAAVGNNLDIAALVAAARPSRIPRMGPVAGLPPLGRRIAVARDEAFAFVYGSVLSDWVRGGVELELFSPLADEAPCARASAVYLPGGYPELHAGRLAAASRFLDGLRDFAADGKPVYGECGGYMVLGETLVDGTGTEHRMAGLLPVATSFAEPRLHLGYRQAALLADHPFGSAGDRFRGHEFHYAAASRQGPAQPLFLLRDSEDAKLDEAGMMRGGVSGSFIHLIDSAAED
ncbi:MAG TPA: cobyrinate a,c-diamide synthase [Stellaceae bacterium]|nr:cobyrinate a,c-diamide synthase [Stellaceae bacterium]